VRIGEMLVRAAVVNELQLNAALAEQQQWGGRVGQILVRMGAVSEDVLVLALCRQLALPKAELSTLTSVPDALKERVTQEICDRYHVLPMAYVHERRAVQLAMSDPFDVVALDDLTRLLGTKVEAFLAGDQALSTAIRRLYSAAAPSSLASSMDLEFVDNAGNKRPDGTGEFATVPPGSSHSSSPFVPPSSSSNILAAPVSTAAQSAQLAQRIDEQARAVRAVADLLAERGYIPPISRR
jgi:hypothetical protein